jgi:hypothetical protein
MIKEAKDVLQGVVEARIPEAAVARSGAEETRAIMARKWPLVSFITNPGRFDDRTAKTYRYWDAENETYAQRYVRGSRACRFCSASGPRARTRRTGYSAVCCPPSPRHGNWTALRAR